MNRFAPLASNAAEETAAWLTLPELEAIGTLSASADVDRVRLKMSRVEEVPTHPDFLPDFAERRRALREGRLFPTRSGYPWFQVLQRPKSWWPVISGHEGTAFEPLLLVEFCSPENTTAAQREVLRRCASLVLQEQPGHRLRAWFYLPVRVTKQGAAARLARQLSAAEQRAGAWLLDGVEFPGARVSVHRFDSFHQGHLDVTLGSPGGDWQLDHWSWRPHSVRRFGRLLRKGAGGPSTGRSRGLAVGET